MTTIPYDYHGRLRRTGLVGTTETDPREGQLCRHATILTIVKLSRPTELPLCDTVPCGIGPRYDLGMNTYFDAIDPETLKTNASGPSGSLPLSDEILKTWTSGDLFGLTQSVGMGFDPRRVLGDQYLILSTQGGVRAPDGTPIALGYHTGHWEVGLLVQAAAEQICEHEGVPFAAFVSDPCDGRTQGTHGMFDSLPYRNDAAITMRRLIRSLPRRKGVIGIATCDKGLPAMMMALAGCGDLANVLVPGGVTLPPTQGEDAGKVQTIGARYSRGEMSLEEASLEGCRACGTPGGGCQFLGTAATSQVVGEALGMTVPHAALAASGQPIWTKLARDSANASRQMHERGTSMKDILTEDGLVQRDVDTRSRRRQHQPVAAHSRHRPRGRTPASWRRRISHDQSTGATVC